MEEHLGPNERVAGSNPVGGAIDYGVEESGRPRDAHNVEIVDSNSTPVTSFAGVVAQFWLEHRLVTPKVAGSIPVYPASYHCPHNSSGRVPRF